MPSLSSMAANTITITSADDIELSTLRHQPPSRKNPWMAIDGRRAIIAPIVVRRSRASQWRDEPFATGYRRPPMQDVLSRANLIRAVIFDVDGVLTDGSLYLGDDGQEYKAFHSRDGHGMVMLRDSGVVLGVITGRRSEVVRIRMESLGISHVYQGRRDKLPAYEELKQALDLNDGQLAYVGDDVVDLPILRRAGLAIAVADAHPLVIEHSHWCTQAPGGRGAAREVCELILRAQGTLDAALARYF